MRLLPPSSAAANNLGLFGQQIALAALAVAILIWLTGGLILVGNVPWLSAVVYVALATLGLCLLLALCSLHIAQEDRRRRRQFHLRLILLAFVGLGMLLAGVTGVFRSLAIDTSGMPPQAGFELMIFTLVLPLPAVPLLVHLLAVVVTLANIVIRLPAVRRFFTRRSARTRNDSHLP